MKISSRSKIFTWHSDRHKEKRMDQQQKSGPNKIVLAVIAAAIAVFLALTLVPQSFWVNVSMMFFK